MAKARRVAVLTTTRVRSKGKVGRLFIDLTGPKSQKSLKGSFDVMMTSYAVERSFGALVALWTTQVHEQPHHSFLESLRSCLWHCDAVSLGPRTPHAYPPSSNDNGAHSLSRGACFFLVRVSQEAMVAHGVQSLRFFSIRVLRDQTFSIGNIHPVLQDKAIESNVPSLLVSYRCMSSIALCMGAASCAGTDISVLVLTFTKPMKILPMLWKSMPSSQLNTSTFVV